MSRQMTFLWLAVLALTLASCTSRSDSESETHDAAADSGKKSAPEVPQRGDSGTPKTREKPGLREPQMFLTEQEIEEGWIQLFDGQTLFGWQANNDVNWAVQEGVISADSGEPGLLLTSVPFANYEFRCDFRLEKGGNSGVFFHTPPKPTDPAVDCYELNIADENPFPTGSFVKRRKLEEPPHVEGEWHTYDVAVEGSHLVVRLDGKAIMDFDDKSEHALRSGHIGLQKNTGRIEFRKVALKPLAMQPLFDGKSLAGWHVVPGSQSEFTVKDGAIHVENGLGFLESDETFGNFVLQLTGRTNGTHLNSGLFFRAMKGTAEAPSNGYEMQIHHGFKDGDRTRPVDAGTGAVFRRTQARWVVPDDGEWFYATLIAYGPRICVWVNGFAVTDWVDERKPDENPRKGKRLAAGHLSLQGHDPTTNLDFRQIRVSEYP